MLQHALSKGAEVGGEAELRKDRTFPMVDTYYRIYLGNLDELRKVSKTLVASIEGEVTSLVLRLREEYASLGVPRHPKKAVASKSVAEVQGAIIDGVTSVAYPKVEKVMKYMHLAHLLLLESGESTQKQMQIVGGGLVYIAMFRRPLLGSLNPSGTSLYRAKDCHPLSSFQSLMK